MSHLFSGSGFSLCTPNGFQYALWFFLEAVRLTSEPHSFTSVSIITKPFFAGFLLQAVKRLPAV